MSMACLNACREMTTQFAKLLAAIKVSPSMGHSFSVNFSIIQISNACFVCLVHLGDRDCTAQYNCCLPATTYCRRFCRFVFLFFLILYGAPLSLTWRCHLNQYIVTCLLTQQTMEKAIRWCITVIRVIEIGSNQKHACSFLLVFCCNYMPIFYLLRCNDLLVENLFFLL